MSKDKLMPELRFPEFKNEGEWELTTIGDIGKFYYGKSAPKWSLSDDAPTPCVRYGELYTKFGTIITEIKSRTNIEPSDLKFSKGGEILVPRVGEVATDFAKNCCYLPIANIAIGEMISVFETKEFPIFYAYYFRILWREFAKVVEGQNVKNLYYVNLEPIKIGKTFYKEQQKIASCLSSLDEVITAHSQKLVLLKEHKKGLMQNLFPQEGETVPKYRFPEFKNDVEWVEKSLESLTTKISDGIHTTPNYDDSGEYYFINGNNLIDGKIWIDEKTKRVSEEEYYKHKRDLSESSILLSINGTIGNISVFNNEKVILGKSACYINVNETKVNKTFTIYFIQTESTKKYFHSELTGSTIKNLSLKSIKETIIKVPVRPQEQQKIASCLSSLDTVIAEQVEKIAQLKLHKQGLIQGLFPKIND